MKHQATPNGPLTPEAIEFLKEIRAKNGWSFKTLGEYLSISQAFTYNIVMKGQNITTATYMQRIENGIEQLRAGLTDLPRPAVLTSATKDRIRDHPFHLRDGLTISLALPADLTEREADRLALFIRSLAQ